MPASDTLLMLMAAAPLAALLGAIVIVALIIRRQAQSEHTITDGEQIDCSNNH